MTPHFEVAQGLINGVNTAFTVSLPYIPGTSAVYLNGLLLRPDWDNGWLETDPLTGLLNLKEAPLAADTVQVFFLDTALPLPETEISSIRGHIREISTAEGRLLFVSELRGKLVTC